MTYHNGQTWKADVEYKSFENHVLDLTSESSVNSDLWVYMCKDTFIGYVGIAYVGTLCKNNYSWKPYRSSINEKMANIASTAEVYSSIQVW